MSDTTTLRATIRDLTRERDDALNEVDRLTSGRGFSIGAAEQEAERAFLSAHEHLDEDHGSIGGGITYMFCCTSIGHIVTLRCACGASVDLTGDL